MKKIFILLFTVIITITLSAQPRTTPRELPKKNMTALLKDTTTVTLFDSTITVMRINDADLKKNVNVQYWPKGYNSIYQIQQYMSVLKQSIEQNPLKPISHFDELKRTISDLSNDVPGFDKSYYQGECDFYIWADAINDTKRRVEKIKEDSVSKQLQKTEDSVIAATQPKYNHSEFISSYKDLGNDSSAFAYVFGSTTEYNFQHSVRNSNGYNYIMHFIDARPYYTIEMLKFLAAEEKCSGGIYVNEDGNAYFEAEDKGCPPATIGDEKMTPVKIKAYCNPIHRVNKVTITGDATAVIHLFLFYWEWNNVTLGKLKKGYSVYKNSGDDRVTFSWKGTDPIITITKNPGITMFSKNIPMN